MTTEIKRPSERQFLAQQCAEFINQNNLNNPFGGEAVLSQDQNKKKYYVIPFSKPKILDGAISIYSKNFILVRFQTEFRALPHQGNIKFSSKEIALEFIKNAFVDKDFDKAMKIIKNNY